MQAGGGSVTEQLVASGLVTAEQLATCISPMEPTPDAATLLNRLVQKRLLTKWQAEQIFAGRYKDFFLAHYKLLRPLREFGMVRYFEAVDTQLNRPVVVKIAPSTLESGEENARFREEGAIALKLRHENIVHTFQMGRQGPFYYLVLELVEGCTLFQFMTQCGRLSVAQTASIAYQVLQGLEYAHTKDIVHGDITPANITITRDGRIKLVVVGLAKNEGRTAVGSLSIDYCAPELGGDVTRATAGSDIYALGCTLYHCLTGRPPFPSGTPTQKIALHRTAYAPRIESIRHDVSPSFVNLIHRDMLSKDPLHRFISAGDGAQEFRRWVPGQMIYDELTALTSAAFYEQHAQPIFLNPRH